MEMTGKLYYDSNDYDDGSIELCPFCQGEAHLDFVPGSGISYRDKQGSGFTTRLYHVVCDDCGARTAPWVNIELAKEAWNTRRK